MWEYSHIRKGGLRVTNLFKVFQTIAKFGVGGFTYYTPIGVVTTAEETSSGSSRVKPTPKRGRSPILECKN